MTANEILEAAKALPREERLKLAQDIWEIGEEDCSDSDLSPEQMEELKRRLADSEANPHDGIPFAQVKAELKQRYGWK